MRFLLILAVALFLAGCRSPQMKQKEVEKFLDDYTKKYQELYYASSRAEWASNTHIVEGDSTNAIATRQAEEAMASYTGSEENIKTVRQYLAEKANLKPLENRQLERMLYLAADNPQTVPDLVRERIKVETEEVEKLYGFDYKIDGKSVSTNEIDDILDTQTNLKKRLQAWQVSKEVGKVLRPGLLKLQKLRNQTVQALGYDNYFSYQVSDYGMTTPEMMALNQQFIREIWPLYRELHTYARYELARKYGVKKVPDYLPADWLPNRWGQDWNAMVTIKGMDLDAVLREKTADWIMHQGERFYLSLGFPALPASFWEKSSLYPLPPDAGYKKNNHASAWHMNLGTDVRCLMSVVPNAEWYETVHHELGHIYYFISYTNPDVPILLREGANRAFHEALGSLMGLASMQKPFLAHLDILPANTNTDSIRALLKEALNYIVFIPWSSGVMTEFEYRLYAKNLPANQINRTWWNLKKKYQGIVPPAHRGEEYCDPCSKTHIIDDAAQYYDYALSYALLFQFHEFISRNILAQDPHATDYYGSIETGDFLRKIMYPGATEDWRKLLLDNIGEEMSAQAMLNYFQPLMNYLVKQNTGRKYTLPEKFGE
jgi:peptidyl-dipeptidase A